MTMSEDEKLKLLRDDKLDIIKVRATKDIVICLERFLRALARTVTHTGLKGEAKSLGTGVWDFLAIQDNQLGKTEYNVINS